MAPIITAIYNHLRTNGIAIKPNGLPNTNSLTLYPDQITYSCFGLLKEENDTIIIEYKTFNHKHTTTQIPLSDPDLLDKLLEDIHGMQ